MIIWSLKDSRFADGVLETIILTRTKVDFNKYQLKLYRLYLLKATSNCKIESRKEHWIGSLGT